MVDKKYRLPRIWSNAELKKFAHLFTGDVVNVSGWKDIDKQGAHYRDYFINCSSYFISNYKGEWRGLQGFDNEFFLDLTEALDERYRNRFEVVFNHTTLEHIYDVKQAFKNLCLMSSDIVIIVVPFLQQMHGDYGDYWRFSPLTIKNLFEENGLGLLYLSFNNHRGVSVYIFAVASRNPEKWRPMIGNEFSIECKRGLLDDFENYIGCRAINNTWCFRFLRRLSRLLKKKHGMRDNLGRQRV